MAASSAAASGSAGARSGTRGTRPFAGFEWMIAGRYLRARRKEGFISVTAWISFIGIMLGVATLIIVMAVMNGFRSELMSKILGVNGHIIVQGLGQPLNDYDALATTIRGLPGIRAAFPFVEGQALASSASSAGGVLVRGVREADLGSIGVSDKLKEGTTAGFDSGQGILIGRRLAEQLGLRTGDTLTLVSPRGAVTPMGTTPRIKGYPIAGVFELGMSEYDGAIIFLPLKEAQAYFNRVDDVTAIEVYVDDPDRVSAIKLAIEENTDRQLYLLDWRQRNQTFFSALEVERNVMFMILTLIVLVAALNIVSTLYMLVKDKGPDVAILRTMGATRGAILRVFLITGTSIGVIGTLAGLGLGLVVCANIESIRQFISRLTSTELFSPELYFLSQLPAEVQLDEVLAVVGMALALSVLASLYPAWRAARLDPVEALRYE